MTKSEFIEGLQKEYRQWEELLAQIGPKRMDLPGVSGPWSIKDVVAHINAYRIRTVRRLQAATRGEADPQPAWPTTLKLDDEINAWIYEKNHSRSVQDVLDESEQVFDELVAAIQNLPDEILKDPQQYLPWLEGDPFSPEGFFGHFHEEHEADMRAWLSMVEEDNEARLRRFID